MSYNVTQMEVHSAQVVPQFDNHALADKPIFTDDNTRPHRTHSIGEISQQEAIDTFQWPAMSYDRNPIEQVWDCIGRKVKQLYLQCQTQFWEPSSWNEQVSGEL